MLVAPPQNPATSDSVRQSGLQPQHPAPLTANNFQQIIQCLGTSWRDSTTNHVALVGCTAQKRDKNPHSGQGAALTNPALATSPESLSKSVTRRANNA